MITLKSHGFKFGRPDASMYFDVSYFKNPWRDERIRNETDLATRTALILESMKSQEGCETFVERIAALLRLVYVLYPNENVIVALCCSAGEYRSPAMVSLLSKALEGVPHTLEQNPYSKI